jgi:tetratricopeptide (TPR) repeat protein
VLRRGQRIHPRDFWLNVHLAMLLLADRPADAARFYTVALSLRPDAPAVLVGLGNALAATGDLDEAADCFVRAAWGTKDFALPHYNLGNVRQRQGRYAEAIAAFREAIRIQPRHVSAHTNLGTALLDEGRVEEALIHLTRATELNRDHTQAWFNLGMACEVCGDADRGIAALRQANRLNPKDATAWFFLGGMLQRKGEPAEAAAAFRRADELGGGVPGLGYPVRQRLRQAERQLALKPRLPGLLADKEKPASAEECLDWAVLCAATGHPVRAAELYRQAFRDRPALTDAKAGHVFGAVLAAVQAGLGRGDGANLDKQARSAWRRQALQWLRTELDALTRRVTTEPRPRWRGVVLVLRSWRADVGLAGVRAADELKKLPADERQQWQTFWAEVEALFQKARR